MAITRHDVAVEAGTSDAVVSYVINNGPRGVAPQTRARVEEAMAKLNYRPNSLARSLASRRTLTLGFVLPDISNPFFSEVARGLENAAYDAGYTMLFGNAMDDESREVDYLRTLIDRRVDGLVVIPVGGADRWVAEVATAAIPTVILDRATTAPSLSSVTVDNEAGAFGATAHLIAHGHSRIGLVAGPDSLEPSAGRARGWARALTEAGQDESLSARAAVGFGRMQAYWAALELLGTDNRPSAIFVASDEQSAGVYRAAAELGLRIPEDLAIASFDGIESSAFSVPSLTTVQQPIDDAAAVAVRLLLERIEDPSVLPAQEVLQPSLVVRRSCGCHETPAARDHELGSGHRRAAERPPTT